MALVEELRRRALEVGFSGLRVASAEPFEREREAFLGRIAGGYFEGMGWLTPERARVATDPGALLPGARSVISVAMPYARREREWRGGAHGKIARYAWARDYHDVMKERLRELRAFLLEHAPEDAFAVVVDTGRVVDRAVAVRAGLGWYGKNAMVLTAAAGSWVMLGEILTTLELPADPPLAKSCGRCTRCLDECPTGAIVAPGVIESRRCISYLTIEHRGAIPIELRPQVGTWIFGCDVCQEVCPVNHAVGTSSAEALAPVLDPEPELGPLLALDRDEFKRRYGHTPVARAGWAVFLRNVCVALGNSGDPAAVAPLTAALDHPEPLVRSHAAWALGRLGGAHAREALPAALAREPDAGVRAEIASAVGASAIIDADG